MANSNTLHTQTVLDIFAQADPAYIQAEGEQEMLTLTCSVFEGRFCWLGPEYLVGALSKDTTAHVISEIGAQTIANGAQNQVMLRCTKPKGADAPLVCQINGGSGWRAYPLSV